MAIRKTHCKNGHDRTLPGALYGGGQCRICTSSRTKERAPLYRERKNAAARIARATDPAKHRHYVRRYYLMVKYGMKETEFEAMWSRVNGKCEMCGDALARKKGGFAIDHCHRTGTIRGLLCNHCNSGLGYFRDSPRRLEAAIAYILRNVVEAEGREAPHPA